MSKKYEDPLPRDVRQIDPPEPQKYRPSKKGRGKWCHKKPGREHTPQVRVSTRWGGWLRHCGESEGRWSRWQCRHESVCTGCSKILHWSLKKEDCPDWLASQEVR